MALKISGREGASAFIFPILRIIRIPLRVRHSLLNNEMDPYYALAEKTLKVRGNSLSCYHPHEITDSEVLRQQDLREGEVTYARHHIGTCRMGDNPKTSVTDRNLHVHESPNLYVCGSEVFVSRGAVPPVLTITALSHRLFDHLISRLQNGQE